MVRNRGLKALSDFEYDIIIRKIIGTYNTAVSERSKEEKVVLRKYYRWIENGCDVRVGSSGKTIYVDDKQLLRESETERIIKRAENESKSSGSRKLAGRVNARYVGCTESSIIKSKANSKSLQVRKLILSKLTSKPGLEMCRTSVNVRQNCEHDR